MNYADMVNQLEQLIEQFIASKIKARMQMLPEILRHIEALLITIRRRLPYACPSEKCVSLTGVVKAMASLSKPPDYDDAFYIDWVRQDIYQPQHNFADRSKESSATDDAVPTINGSIRKMAAPAAEIADAAVYLYFDTGSLRRSGHKSLGQ